jgi:hypothetical protein
VSYDTAGPSIELKGARPFQQAFTRKEGTASSGVDSRSGTSDFETLS